MIRILGHFGIDKKIIDYFLFITSLILVGNLLINGIGFLIIGADDISHTETYALMEKFMSIRWWGIMFIINVAITILALLARKCKYKYAFYIASGLMGAGLTFIYSVASFETSTYLIHSFRFLLTLSWHGVIALLGVLMLCQNHKSI
ncbi:hypothetical protein ACI2JA_04210 [Alkalihalobacillus sp. NPDC078783]